VGQLGAPLDHERGSATAERVGDESVAVHLAATQREEHTTLLHLARIGVEGPEGVSDLGASDLATTGRLEELEEGQLHTSSVERRAM